MTKLSTLETGFFQSDGGAMFGLLPKSIWHRHYHADNKNICQMAMRVILYKKKERIVLFDTGCGTKKDKRMTPYGFSQQKDLRKLLATRQIAPGEVTDIVLSHLHFDHCGGITYRNDSGQIVETFPNATYHISRRQWEHHLHPGILDTDAYFAENTSFLQNNARLHLIDNDQQISDDIEVCLYNGHTPGQLVSFIRDKQECFVFAGDVVPLALNLRIDSISAFDLSAETAAEERKRLLERIVRDDAFVYFYHDAYTIGSKIKKTGNRYICY